MRIFRAEYTGGVKKYIHARNHYYATKQASKFFPGHELKKVAVAKELAGAEFTPWNLLALGNEAVPCAACAKTVLPVRVWGDHVTKAEKRPCHDEGGNVFCNPGCREDFRQTYGDGVRIITAYDYDTWAPLRVPVPLNPERLAEWEQEWALVELGDKTVLIAAHRYRRMTERAREVRGVIYSGEDGL